MGNYYVVRKFEVSRYFFERSAKRGTSRLSWLPALNPAYHLL